MSNTVSENEYWFFQDFFSYNAHSLASIFNMIKPQKVLNIGANEGRAMVFFAEEAFKYNSAVEIHCVDNNWLKNEGEISTSVSSMEEMFLHNANVLGKKFNSLQLLRRKVNAQQLVIKLASAGYENSFDFIYIDNTYDAADILLYAVLSHRLLRVNGVMAFNNYSKDQTADYQNISHYNLVKPAVDHYVNTYQQKINILQNLPLTQFYVQKVAE